jgi:hypothetical protein
MTPAQRKFDVDLVASMRRMAQRIEPRSRQLSDALKLAATRIDALSSAAPVEPAPQLAQDGQIIHQPASTPDQAQHLYGEGYGRDGQKPGAG